ncbi:MAG: lysylphosphatidylglycerol synthase domain-containing protein [Solirubrobacteraceae bacterium]
MSLESDHVNAGCSAAAEPGFAFRRKAVLSVLGALAVTGALGFVLAGHRSQFAAALRSAPLSLLLLAALLQIIALLARSEAWFVCVRAAGATVSRRLLFRAAGVGYLASVLNGSVGMATRIASLRRAAPHSAPRVPALLAAEVPIITVEVALAAIFSFTLIAPLGAPWWAPAIAVVAMAGVIFGLRRLSESRRTGLWAGLAVVRNKGRVRMIAFTLLAVCAQIARNWLMLHAIGVNVSVFDAMALLIAMFTLGQLPIGPSIGPAAAVLILGAHGVAATAAAGVLLAVTGISGSLCYAAWAIADRTIAGRLESKTEIVAAPAAVAVAVRLG